MRTAAILAVAFLTILEQSANAQPIESRPLPETADTRLAELAKHIPGFGGFFYVQQQPVVFLVGSAGTAAARKEFGADVHILPAKFTVPQLVNWREQLRSALSLPGAVFLDMDEARNRVVIGIDQSTAQMRRPAFVAHIAALRIPLDAVIIEETPPAVNTSTLQDDIRPQPGGVRIEFYLYDGTPEHCTLGFNVGFEKGSGFVTCSHCTQNEGQLDGDNVGYGVEERDPAYGPLPGCPANKRCRMSDSALIYYAFVNEQGAGGEIARTTSSGTCLFSEGVKTFPNASLTIDPNNPHFSVVGSQSPPGAGSSIARLGQTTGWVTGTVIQTCVDIAEGTDIVKLCQDTADFGAERGDSGSPVFHMSGSDVILDGMLWGSFAGTCTAAFSPVSGIQYDIGPFTVN